MSQQLTLKQTAPLHRVFDVLEFKLWLVYVETGCNEQNFNDQHTSELKTFYRPLPPFYTCAHLDYSPREWAHCLYAIKMAADRLMTFETGLLVTWARREPRLPQQLTDQVHQDWSSRIRSWRSDKGWRTGYFISWNRPSINDWEILNTSSKDAV